MSMDCGIGVAVKFILGTLVYIANVVVKNGGQDENGTVEDDNSDDGGDEVDSEMQELMDVSLLHYFSW